MINTKKQIEKKEKEYIFDGTHTYLLYDKNNKLLDIAYNEDDVKKISQEYTGGTWFVCSNTKDSNVMFEDGPYKKRVKFSKKVKEKNQKTSIEEIEFSSKWGDLR